MHVFIDTNIFLSFYHLTSEDLGELEKLAKLIEGKECTLEILQQVIDETWRNRAAKIKESFDAFKKARLSISFPAYCKDYDEYEEMRDALGNLDKKHSAMVDKIEADINSRGLAADKLIQRLFGLADVVGGPRTRGSFCRGVGYFVRRLRIIPRRARLTKPP